MSFFPNIFIQKFRILAKGFTLIELLIVVSIVTLLSTVVLLNFPKYSASQQLQLTAQDVLTTVRETQLYGIAVRGVTTSSGTLYKSQGLYLNPTFLASTTSMYFMTYIDADHTVGSNDGLEGFNQGVCSDVSVEGPCFIKQISLPIVAHDFCIHIAGTATTTDKCYLKEAPDNIVAIDILFQRPEPEPKIWGIDVNGTRYAAQYAQIKLIARAENGQPISVGTKVVSVWNTGQVSINGEETVIIPKEGGGK